MARGQDVDVRGLPRSRPWLLPTNRKLRHLQGLSIRNIELNKTRTRPRGKTADDESLPASLRTPTKAIAQREIAKLEHSKSSNDLRKGKQPEILGTEEKKLLANGKKDDRPMSSRLKRRSTLNWTNASPTVRQQKLEEVTAQRMADVWFSLHVEDVEEPIYVSEVIERTMNPSFQFFDLKTYGAYITRRDELVIKIWAHNQTANDYQLLLEISVNLRSLCFISKTLEGIHHPLTSNAVLFHLADGIYTSFTDLPPNEPAPTFTLTSKRTKPRTESTSSFDALMQLSNLDNCIQDALLTRDKLAGQINKILDDQKASRSAIVSAAQAENALQRTNRSLSLCKKQVQSSRHRCESVRASLASRREAIAKGRDAQSEAEIQMQTGRKLIADRREDHKTVKSNLSGQIRRIGEDLGTVYVISPMADGSLSFTINGLHLPTASALTEKDTTTTSAALGHAAHVCYLLSFYLSTHLPYPITIHGSTSTIQDPISSSMPSEAARVFPLFQKGAVEYRFEYGVFLLNSNIELLMSKQGARMVDLRYTLGNLKYILTVITEGKGEIPGRKRGQIKGLNGSIKGSSRSSSIVSKREGKEPESRLRLWI